MVKTDHALLTKGEYTVSGLRRVATVVVTAIKGPAAPQAGTCGALAAVDGEGEGVGDVDAVALSLGDSVFVGDALSEAVREPEARTLGETLSDA